MYICVCYLEPGLNIDIVREVGNAATGYFSLPPSLYLSLTYTHYTTTLHTRHLPSCIILPPSLPEPTHHLDLALFRRDSRGWSRERSRERRRGRSRERSRERERRGRRRKRSRSRESRERSLSRKRRHSPAPGRSVYMTTSY